MNADDYMALIPDAHKQIVDGKLCLTELGAIHLSTFVEQYEPEKAKNARRVRYGLQKMAKELRKS